MGFSGDAGGMEYPEDGKKLMKMIETGVCE